MRPKHGLVVLQKGRKVEIRNTEELRSRVLVIADEIRRHRRTIDEEIPEEPHAQNVMARRRRTRRSPRTKKRPKNKKKSKEKKQTTRRNRQGEETDKEKKQQGGGRGVTSR